MRVMFGNTERLLYCGPIGRRSVAVLGSITVHIPLGNTFQIRVSDGPWEEKPFAFLMPYVPHEFKPMEGTLVTLNIEPESIDDYSAPWFANGVDEFLFRLAGRIKLLIPSILHGGFEDVTSTSDIDNTLFGFELPFKQLDSRIEYIIERIRRNPCAKNSVGECAFEANLSYSRFSHLFRREVGTSFRQFRAWKRARSILQHVNPGANLTDIALAAGYPDSTHFSHSIRNIYGLRPSEIFPSRTGLPNSVYPTT